MCCLGSLPSGYLGGVFIVPWLLGAAWTVERVTRGRWRCMLLPTAGATGVGIGGRTSQPIYWFAAIRLWVPAAVSP